MTLPDVTFGERLALELAERGMTQRELARRVEVSPQAVTHWIKGSGRPSWDRLIRIEDELEIPRGELLRLLGYRPEDREPGFVSIEDAIKADPDIAAEDKRALLRMIANIRRADQSPAVDEPVRPRAARSSR